VSQAPVSNKLASRYSLGMFLLSNWLYNTVVVGDNGIANFDNVPSDVFTDKLFFLGAFKQFENNLSANIGDKKILDEMMESKSFLLNKAYLKQVSHLDEEKMAKMVEEGHSVYELLLGKKLSESVIFDDEVMPSSYSSIDGSDNSAQDETIPMHLVFNVDSDTLSMMEKLLDFNNNTIVDEVITHLKTDEKFKNFSPTFDLLKRLETV
jgi:hypothetical protein